MEQLHNMLDGVSLETVAYWTAAIAILLIMLYLLSGRQKSSGGKAHDYTVWLEDVAGISKQKKTSLNYKYPLLIGRVASKHKNVHGMVIEQSTVGRLHAVVDFHDGCFWVTDQSSTNGTFVNGKRLTQPHRLHNGDIIMFHQYPFRFTSKLEIEGDKTVVAGEGAVDEATEIVSAVGSYEPPLAAAASNVTDGGGESQPQYQPPAENYLPDAEYEDALDDLVGDKDDLSDLQEGSTIDVAANLVEKKSQDGQLQEDMTLDNFIDDDTMSGNKR